jgi:hypothetical protein
VVYYPGRCNDKLVACESSTTFAQTALSLRAAVVVESEDGADGMDRDLMNLDEAANTSGDGEEVEQGAQPEEAFGSKLDLGPNPWVELLRLSLVERVKWFWGFPLSSSEMAQRIMTTLDIEKKGSLPLSALDFILKNIQGHLPLTKESFDLAEVCSASLCFSCNTAWYYKLPVL